MAPSALCRPCATEGGAWATLALAPRADTPPHIPPFQTLHLVHTHGSRYEVDMAHGDQLRPLLDEGRARIRRYAQTLSRGDEFAHSSFDEISVVGR